MELFFDSMARASDGREVGPVRLVVVDTQTLEVTHIVVEHAGGDRLLPITLIQDADRDVVDLRTDVDLGQFPLYVPESVTPFREAQVGDAATPASESRAMALRPTNVALNAMCKVEALDGPLGTLEGVHLDIYRNALTSILVVASAQQRCDVPVKWISEIGSGRIRLATNSKNAGRLVGPEAGPYLSIEGEEQHGV